MSKFSCNTARLCAPLLVMFLLAAARGELTSAEGLAPDPDVEPIADKSTFLPPRVMVRNMREDRDGNIWFATYGGPLRYDGKTFTNFAEEAGIANQRIFSLLVDKSGALWFGSVTGGASKYDGKSFTRFTTKEGLSGNHISWIFEDDRGDVWFGTEKGVSRYDGKAFTHYSTKDGLPHDSVHAIAQDRSGKLWFGTQEGIAFYDGKTFINFAGIAGREFQNIRSIVEDKAGTLWFGGQFGVYRYDGKTGTMLTAKDGLLDDMVSSMIVDKAGSIWFGHPNDERRGGATRYDGKTFAHFTLKEGLPTKEVYSMLEDREGRIWFGTGDYGASRYDGKTFTNFSPAPLPTKTTAGPDTSPGSGINTKYQYTDSNGARLIIENGFPRGGLRYKDPHGKEYVYAVLWTRIINETFDPLELTIDFPLDSFSPGNPTRVLLSSDLSEDDLWGTVKSFLDNNLHKPSSLKTTINPKGARTFYVVVLNGRGGDGVVRTGLRLEEQNLVYRVDDKEIHCGKINLKHLRLVK